LVIIVCLLAPGVEAGQKTLVLNTTGLPPLNTRDQRGFLDRVTAEAFSRLGIRLKTVRLPAERGLMNSNAGIEDGEMSRIAGLDKIYPNLVRVPEKIMDWVFVGFSRKPIRIDKGWSSLSPYSVAIIRGWKIYEKHVPAASGLTKVKTPQQLFVLLVRGRVDIILYERWNGMHMVRRDYPGLRMLRPEFARREMFIYLHKKHRALVPRLTAVLRAMKRDGTYQRIYRQILIQHAQGGH
jgi:polar amino acid transport system substrate-binding protein